MVLTRVSHKGNIKYRFKSLKTWQFALNQLFQRSKSRNPNDFRGLRALQLYIQIYMALDTNNSLKEKVNWHKFFFLQLKSEFKCPKVDEKYQEKERNQHLRKNEF